MTALLNITNLQPLEEYIESRITASDLEQRLRKESIKGKLQGAEHCFRDSSPWYHLNVGYTNPINFGTVHAELSLIAKNMGDKNNPLGNAIFEKNQVFYGVGVGDTEIAFVDWAIKKKQKIISIIGIDVNKDFLENYIIALKNRTQEPDNPNLFFKGYHALFEQVTKTDFLINESPAIHICLGGTIGNFLNQYAMAELFSNLVRTNEKLVLGVQLDKNIDYLFQKYVTNPLYTEFILNYVPLKERQPLQWTINKDSGVITAIHKDIEVFRTKKYSPKKLQQLMKTVDFELEYQSIDEYNNSCLQLYNKI